MSCAAARVCAWSLPRGSQSLADHHSWLVGARTPHLIVRQWRKMPRAPPSMHACKGSLHRLLAADSTQSACAQRAPPQSPFERAVARVVRACCPPPFNYTTGACARVHRCASHDSSCTSCCSLIGRDASGVQTTCHATPSPRLRAVGVECVECTVSINLLASTVHAVPI